MIITLMGATASGKTAIAARLAHTLAAEIISADSRQVYRGMNIGTGKDLNEYTIDGQAIPYHLIDIVDPGYRYNLYEYSRDFHIAQQSIAAQGKPTILCGGSGLYIEAIIKGYQLIDVPPDRELRTTLETKTLDQLKDILASLKPLHNTSDVDNRKRAIRAIEIEQHRQHHAPQHHPIPIPHNIIFEIRYDRQTRRQRITTRLHQRLEQGLVDEAKTLIRQGLTIDDMLFYGLEYKYLALHLSGRLAYNHMVEQLNTAIHQYAKRQTTWFRGMERRGVTVHHIDGHLSDQEKIHQIRRIAGI